ncbi:hypothetical protein [Thalassotalea hakodatensis]|uniref:hypothetical protein n=1 Tax=Thalassotalea hakodatensis TaxID=3030492 RepID=UPI0025722193|nr:hypothetical protein [Thalassotalea hakodatensis]
MFNFIFSRKPLIDSETQQWLFSCVEWAISTFEQQYFTDHTELILPTNKFYPGRVASVEQMARTIFENTKSYCGLSNWPFMLKPFQYKTQQQLPHLTITGSLRGEQSKVIANDESSLIEVGYLAAQINQPQDMIATYVQQFASVLVLSAKVLPPGGKPMIQQAIDVLACVMGFGVMFTNTAYQFKGGCGSCYNPRANRQVALPENDMLYALAIFCVLKNEHYKNVTPHLKKHLRSSYKKMFKQVQLLQSSSEKNILTIA